MKLKVYRKPSNSQIYCCSTSDVKEKLKDIDFLHVDFGFIPVFKVYQRSYRKKPTLTGIVVASANTIGSNRLNILPDSHINDFGKCRLSFYPINVKEYPNYAIIDFRENTLPQIVLWFKNQMFKNDNARLLDEQLVVEWVNGKHSIHVLT